ncbi:sulfurtransferase TusA family protein [Aliikangiella coralliicola]|uniref:Sulfurtransferase TusA family protein n=1 Tax=Aliikangiella coralliicola TaxID=2592383 RepID=A0A545U8J3_9GAMM|nr:sulfurtransferase TusA family protein [Aliikangiella coralliicola]TQV85790.1 sulfurtransferase TusA family protein [Aliikangiella coralliicola]
MPNSENSDFDDNREEKIDVGRNDDNQQHLDDGIGEKHDYNIDATNINCPLPLLKMKQALNQAKVGEVLFVRVTDPVSERDFKAYLKMTNHQMKMKIENNEYLYWIKKID